MSDNDSDRVSVKISECALCLEDPIPTESTNSHESDSPDTIASRNSAESTETRAASTNRVKQMKKMKAGVVSNKPADDSDVESLPESVVAFSSKNSVHRQKKTNRIAAQKNRGRVNKPVDDSDVESLSETVVAFNLSGSQSYCRRNKTNPSCCPTRKNCTKVIKPYSDESETDISTHAGFLRKVASVDSWLTNTIGKNLDSQPHMGKKKELQKDVISQLLDLMRCHIRKESEELELMKLRIEELENKLVDVERKAAANNRDLGNEGPPKA